MPITRGNQRSARSTACRLATRVAPRLSPRCASWPTVRSANAGSIADTGSSASSRSGRWYSTRATPTRCNWPPERRSQRSNRRSAEVQPRQLHRGRRRCRRDRAARAPTSTHGHWPRRPAMTAVMARWRGGIGGPGGRRRCACAVAAARRRSAARDCAEHLDPPLGRAQRGGEDAQQRGLARARRADDRQPLARRRASDTPRSARWPAMTWREPARRDEARSSCRRTRRVSLGLAPQSLDQARRLRGGLDAVVVGRPWSE